MATIEKTPATCSGCNTEWTGMNTAHCGGCHATFGSVISFDMHRTAPVRMPDDTVQVRKSGRCAAPETVGLTLSDIREYECYVRPEDDSFRRRIVAAKALKDAA